MSVHVPAVGAVSTDEQVIRHSPAGALRHVPECCRPVLQVQVLQGCVEVELDAARVALADL
jgi:hypothetical protein